MSLGSGFTVKLQQGRAPLSAEVVRSDAATEIAVKASTGPRSFERGGAIARRLHRALVRSFNRAALL